MKHTTAMACLALVLSCLSLGNSAEEIPCLSCHDYGPDSPVHPMLEGPHARVMGNCERCHGPSLDHQSRPTIAAPDNSFGPRWPANIAEQDSTCLRCHRRNAGKHWQDSLHMVNNLTCTTCHELHVREDPITAPGGQMQVCTNCHEPQRDGIHQLQAHRGDNPDCTSCHNPHADQSPQATMLTNDSAGCRTCHDLAAMAQDASVRSTANSYHRALKNNNELTCHSCHSGVAHGPSGAH